MPVHHALAQWHRLSSRQGHPEALPLHVPDGLAPLGIVLSHSSELLLRHFNLEECWGQPRTGCDPPCNVQAADRVAAVQGHREALLLRLRCSKRRLKAQASPFHEKVAALSTRSFRN